MKKFRILFLILSILNISSAVEAANHALLIDHSGSVKGFYLAGSMQRLAKIVDTIVTPTRVFLFSEQPIELPTDKLSELQWNPNINPNYTLIDKAFEKAVELGDIDMVWLVTDNIQDEPKTADEKGNTEEFYHRLQSDEVKRIYVFPCFLNFDGILVDAPGLPHYSGQKGLLVYAILLNQNVAEEFKQKVEKFGREVKKEFDATRLFCKPLDKDTIDFRVLGTDEVPGDLPPPNIYYDGEKLVGSNFKAGKPINGIFYVKFISKFKDMEIAAQLEPIQSEFVAEGFKETNVTPRIEPRRLEIKPLGETATIYQVTLQLEKLNIDSLLRVALHRAGSLSGNAKINAEVMGSDFKFREDILDKYNAQDIIDSGEKSKKRIHKMEELVDMVAPEVLRIPAVDSPLELAIKYPWWPFLLLLAGIVAFIALAWFLVWVLTQSEGITVNGERAKISLLRGHTVRMDDRQVAYISKVLLGGMKVKPQRGFLIDGKSTSLTIRPDSIFNVTDTADNPVGDFSVQSDKPQILEQEEQNRKSRRSSSRRRPSRRRRHSVDDIDIDIDI